MTASASLKLGEPRDLRLSARYYQFNRSHAIHDVFDALVELITNCDDSYHRMFCDGLRQEDGGPILIEYLASKDGPSLIVHDRAEGMSLHEMSDKLGDVGTRRSKAGDRGFMARGAKDCSELGTVIFESIKDDKYYKCELTPRAQFVPREERKATREIREKLHIPRSNGTVVTVRLEQAHRLPRFETIARDLPWHFALRDILAEESPTRLLFRNLNRRDDATEKLVYRNPVGEVVFEETFRVEGYGVSAHLKIMKAAEPFEDSSERCRRSGLLVKGERAIYECTLLAPEFERDSLAKKYFGRLECPQIDVLLREYDERREKGETHPPENPSLLVDPNRQRGLHRDHPFTKVLFLVPSERLRALVAADRENAKAQKREIANQETQTRLSRLARRASEFLKQQLEEIQVSEGDEVDKTAFQQGTLLFPTYLNVGVGEERNLTYYAKSSLVEKLSEPRQVQVTVDDPALSLVHCVIDLRPHRSKSDRYLGTFAVRGEAVKDTVIVRAICDGLPEAQAAACVKESGGEERVFDHPLEFAHSEYRVREGSRRSLELFAKYPEVVAEPRNVQVESSDSTAVPIRGTCMLVPVAGSNYARGTVVVQGRKLHAKASITASVSGRIASTEVKVVQKPPESGVTIQIELRDEDYGNFRARWADHENKPNLLLVSARHKSIARYLGPAPSFEGQNLPLFRALLAEIVAESVCRKSLILESRERTWEFRWADLKEDHLIADDVFAKLQQRIRDFVADAHVIMLSDSELQRMDT
jgi:hypothetical protein